MLVLLVMLLLHHLRPDLELRGCLIHYLFVFLDISIIIIHHLAGLTILLFFNFIIVIRDLPGAFPEGLVEFQTVTLVLLAEY